MNYSMMMMMITPANEMTYQLMAPHQCRISSFVGSLDRRHSFARLSESRILQSAGNTAAYNAQSNTGTKRTTSQAAFHLLLLNTTCLEIHDS